MPSKLLISNFTDRGVPKTGLVPLISIIDVDTNTLEVNGASMTELQLGFYKYDFTTYEYAKNYAISVDGTNFLSNSERYQTGTNDSFVEDINDIPVTLLTRVLGLVQENFRIKDQVYNGKGQLTSASLNLYGSKADTIADTNVTDDYTITSTYDVDGKRLEYYVVKN